MYAPDKLTAFSAYHKTACRSERSYETVIVGAGPAGIAVLLAACRAGRLDELLDKGLAVIEATEDFGPGQIGHYAINSDSTAATFIDCIHNNSCPELKSLQSHPLVQKFVDENQNAIALDLVGQLSVLIGLALKKIISQHPACALYLRSKVILARQEHGGTWCSLVSRPDGKTIAVMSTHLVLATGAHQPPSRLSREMIGGQFLQSQCGGRLIQSGEVLRTGGIEQIMRRLAAKQNPKFVVLGGSTSAVSVVHSLLNRMSPALAQPNAVSLLHRRPLRLYYQSVAEAWADGYRDFTAHDLCPLTNRVFRFAGLRLDSKDLIRDALQIGGRQPDPRLRLHHLQAHDPQALQMIAQADLVIACFGYRPAGVKLTDPSNRPINLHASSSACAPLVDDRCRVLDEKLQPLPNLFGIGLAAGFVPRGALGGEASFSGQANGLWLWQTAIGALIIDEILKPQAVNANSSQSIAARKQPRFAADASHNKFFASRGFGKS
jgi:hypothetical protein